MERNMNMGRRGENIRKRKDGRWEARIICSYDGNGKAKYRSLYGKSYFEVKEKKKCFLQNLAQNGQSSYSYGQSTQKVKMNQVVREWLASKKDSVKESTYVNYLNLIEKHILPELGDYYTSAITTAILDNFLREKLRTGRLDGTGGLSPKTVSDIRSVLLMIIEFARQQRYTCDVDAKVFYPHNSHPQMEVMTRIEQAKLERIIFEDPQPLNLGIIVALFGGLRIGEVCALQWEDINLESGTIQIRKTMLRIRDLAPDSVKRTCILIDKPKTESSVRSIPLPSFVVSVLKEAEKEKSCFLITGTPQFVEPRTYLSKYKKILSKAGLKSFTFHALRHTFATRCMENGFDPKSLSEILGHSNVNTTLQRYVHPSLDVKREQMERLTKISE
ncbi:MAG: tyrosine-type recombinase/integrase [Coprococcus sp.]